MYGHIWKIRFLSYLWTFSKKEMPWVKVKVLPSHYHYLSTIYYRNWLPVNNSQSRIITNHWKGLHDVRTLYIYILGEAVHRHLMFSLSLIVSCVEKLHISANEGCKNLFILCFPIKCSHLIWHILCSSDNHYLGNCTDNVLVKSKPENLILCTGEKNDVASNKFQFD